MTHQDPALRTYADNGLRSTEEWRSLGRTVPEGTEPRTRAASGRQEIPLFTRDQTERFVSPHRDRKAK